MTANYFILIPAYNAISSLESLLPSLQEMVSLGSVVIVNDGSIEDMMFLESKYGVHVLTHLENQGKAQALITGMNWGLQQKYQWCITMDADGQHSPSDLNGFLKQIEYHSMNDQSGVRDIGAILGVRGLDLKSMPWPRVFSNRTTSKMLSALAGEVLQDSQCGFRAYSMKALQISKCLEIQAKGFQWESEVLIRLAWSHFRFESIPVQTIYGGESSNISHLSDTIKFLKMWWRLKKESK